MTSSTIKDSDVAEIVSFPAISTTTILSIVDTTKMNNHSTLYVNIRSDEVTGKFNEVSLFIYYVILAGIYFFSYFVLVR